MYTGNTYYSAPSTPVPSSAASASGPIVNATQFTTALDSLKKLQGLFQPVSTSSDSTTTDSSWLDEIQSFIKTNSHASACNDPFANSQFPLSLKSTGNEFIATLAATPCHTSDYFLQFPVPSTVAQYLFNCVNKVDKNPLQSLELTVLHKPDKLNRGPQFYYDFNIEQSDRYVYLYATGSWSQLNIVLESLSFFIDSVRRVTALSSASNNPDSSKSASSSIFSDVQVIDLVWDDFLQYVVERKQWYQFDLETNDYSMKVQPEQVITAAADSSSYSMLFFANAKLIQGDEAFKSQLFANRFLPQVLLKGNAKSVPAKQSTSTAALPVWVAQWYQRELGCSLSVDSDTRLLLLQLPIPNVLSLRKLFSAETDTDASITIELLKSMCVLKVPETKVISNRHDLSLLSRFFYIEIEVACCDLYKCLQLLSTIVQMMQTSEINTGSTENLLFNLHKWICSVTSYDLGSVFPTKMLYNGSMCKNRQKHPLQESYIETPTSDRQPSISCTVHLKLSCEKHSQVIQHLLANNSQQLQSLCDPDSGIEVQLHLDTENSTLYWLNVLFSTNHKMVDIVLAVHHRISQLAQYNTVSIQETKHQSHPKAENELSLVNKKQKITHRYH